MKTNPILWLKNFTTLIAIVGGICTFLYLTRDPRSFRETVSSGVVSILIILPGVIVYKYPRVAGYYSLAFGIYFVLSIYLALVPGAFFGAISLFSFVIYFLQRRDSSKVMRQF